MATATPVLVPLDEYLNTTYRPDRDWIDGETLERNIGETPHATIQGFFTRVLGNQAKEWQIRVFPEQRVQTSGRHYRIADVCVVRRDSPFEPIARTPSPAVHRDPLARRPHERDPGARRRLSRHGCSCRLGRRPAAAQGVPRYSFGCARTRPQGAHLPGTPIRIAVAEINAELDDLEGKSPSEG